MAPSLPTLGADTFQGPQPGLAGAEPRSEERIHPSALPETQPGEGVRPEDRVASLLRIAGRFGTGSPSENFTNCYPPKVRARSMPYVAGWKNVPLWLTWRTGGRSHPPSPSLPVPSEKRGLNTTESTPNASGGAPSPSPKILSDASGSVGRPPLESRSRVMTSIFSSFLGPGPSGGFWRGCT